MSMESSLINNDLDRIEITEIEAASLVVREDSPIFIEAL